MRYLTTLLIIVACFAGGLYLSKLRKEVDSEIVTSTQTPEPSFVVTANVPVGGAFTLTNHRGETISSEAYKEKYMLLYFGYTYCPDLCPSELTTITKALDILGEKGSEIQPFFITIDPKRDTQELLKNYMSLFHPKLVGLFGTQEQLEKACDAYKVYAAKTQDKGGDDYLMDHSTFTYFVGKDGKTLAMFRLGTPPKTMADEILKQLERTS